MQFPSLRGYSVPLCQDTVPVVPVASSSGSRVYNAICRFFLGCTAVSGLAFVATASPVALLSTLALGLVTFCLYFPQQMTSSSYRAHNTARNHFSAPQSTTTYVYGDTPPSHTTVFVDRSREERRELPVDAFFPSNPASPPVTLVEQLQERHPVEGQRVAPQTPPRQDPPLSVVDLQSRHPVGGQRAAPPQPRQAPPPRVVTVEPARAIYCPDPVTRVEQLQERHPVGGQRAAPAPQTLSQHDAEERHPVGKD